MPPSKANVAKSHKGKAAATAKKKMATGPAAAAKKKTKGKRSYLSILQAELGGKKGGSTMQTHVIKRKMKALVPALNEAALKTAIKKLTGFDEAKLGSYLEQFTAAAKKAAGGKLNLDAAVKMVAGN